MGSGGIGFEIEVTVSQIFTSPHIGGDAYEARRLVNFGPGGTLSPQNFAKLL